MSIYDKIKNKIKQIYEEKDDLRVKFNWVEDRFILEFGGQEGGKKKFASYLELDEKLDENKC